MADSTIPSSGQPTFTPLTDNLYVTVENNTLGSPTYNNINEESHTYADIADSHNFADITPDIMAIRERETVESQFYQSCEELRAPMQAEAFNLDMSVPGSSHHELEESSSDAPIYSDLNFSPRKSTAQRKSTDYCLI